MEDNKAYGERTKEDKEKMDKEAKMEIERNFPSYFDEFQRVIFSNGGIDGKEDDKIDHGRDVQIESILAELLQIETIVEKRSVQQKRSLVKLRMKML